jgi:hypothetical protein
MAPAESDVSHPLLLFPAEVRLDGKERHGLGGRGDYVERV